MLGFPHGVEFRFRHSKGRGFLWVHVTIDNISTDSHGYHKELIIEELTRFDDKLFYCTLSRKMYV